MPDLRALGQQVVDNPFREPTAVSLLQGRAEFYVRRRQRMVTLSALGAGFVMVVVLIGLAWSASGASTHRSSVADSATATTLGEATSTTASGETATTAAGATTSTAAASATTAKRSSVTTSVSKKSTATTAAKSVNTPSAISGGLLNVVATTTTAPSGPAVEPGGTATILVPAEPESLDPLRITGAGSVDGLAAAAVFDLLVYVDPASGTIVAQTAESLTSSDGLTWTLKLRPNIKFSDNTVYDAAAVRTNWSRLADPANHARRASEAALIRQMDVIDPLTLKVTLTAKHAQFPYVVAAMPFIASPSGLQTRGAAFATDPVGAGPFTLKRWQRGVELTLLRNPNYWNAPRPWLDGLVLKTVPDDTQRTDAFLAGNAQMELVAVARNAERINASSGPSSFTINLNGGLGVVFNTRKPPFDDPRARQALSMAVDVKDFAKTVDHNLVDPADSIFRHQSPFYDSTNTPLAFNPTRAQQLFDELAQARGGPLTFTLTASTSQNHTAAGSYLQTVLNKYNNVKVTVETEDDAAHTTRCEAGSFDGACLLWTGFIDPEPLWTTMYSCGAPTSPSGWCNAKFDAAIADDHQSVAGTERVAAIKNAQAQFYAEAPAMYVERATLWWYTVPNVQDVRFANEGVPLVDQLWNTQHNQTQSAPAASQPGPTSNDVQTFQSSSTSTTTNRGSTGTTTRATTATTSRSATTAASSSATAASASTAPPTPASAPTTTAGSEVTAGASTTTAVAAATAPFVPQEAATATSSSDNGGSSVARTVLVAILASVFTALVISALVLWRRHRSMWWS